MKLNNYTAERKLSRNVYETLNIISKLSYKEGEKVKLLLGLVFKTLIFEGNGAVEYTYPLTQAFSKLGKLENFARFCQVKRLLNMMKFSNFPNSLEFTKF